MNQEERRKYLIQELLDEREEYCHIEIPQNESSQKLSKVFKDYFDLIVFDGIVYFRTLWSVYKLFYKSRRSPVLP